MTSVLKDQGVYLITSVNSPNHFLKTVGGDILPKRSVDVEQNRNALHCWKAHQIDAAENIWTLRRLPLPVSIPHTPYVALPIIDKVSYFLSVQKGTITATDREETVVLGQEDPEISDVFVITNHNKNGPNPGPSPEPDVFAVTFQLPATADKVVIGTPPVEHQDLQQWRFLQLAVDNLSNA